MTDAVAADPEASHIPDRLVYDFDIYHDPAYLADPHDRILELVAEAPPIFWTPRNGGHWMLMSHEANFGAARDTENFSSELVPHDGLMAILATLPPDAERVPLSYPINLDPPLHGKYRQPLQQVFSPKAIDSLKKSIRELAGELIQSVVGQGHCEFMSVVAEPLPVKVFLKMLGLPVEKLGEYRALVREHLAQTDDTQALLTMQHVAAVMRETIMERKARPRDDIISLLWSIEIDGRPTTIEDIENYGVLLFVAGLDTVMQGMGHGVRHLAQNPAIQDELRHNPERIKDATEEILRRYTFTVPPRRVARDIEFKGVRMKAGERAMLFLPAADLDPREFPQADQFDLNREKLTHIAFNAGPHRCLGSHLARAELQILYQEWLAKVPAFRLDPDNPPTFHGGHVIGVDTLHLSWDT